MKVLLVVMILSACSFCQVCCRQGVASSRKDSGRQSEEAKSDTDKSTSAQDDVQTSGEDHYAKANSLTAGHESEEALNEYHLAIQNGYDIMELRIEMGVLLADRLNRHEEAIEQFRIAVQREPDNWRAHWPLAQSLLATKQYREALKEIQIADRLDPDGHADGFYFFYKAKALDGLNRYAQALGRYEAYLKSYDDVGDTPNVLEARDRLRVLRQKLNLNE